MLSCIFFLRFHHFLIWLNPNDSLSLPLSLSQRIVNGSRKALKEHANQLGALCSMAGLILGLQLLISTESRLRMKGGTFSVRTSFVIRQKSIQWSIWSKPALPPLHNSLHYSDHLWFIRCIRKGFFFCWRGREAESFWSSHLLLKGLIFLLSFCAVSWLWMRGCQKRTPGLFSLADSYLKVTMSLKEHFKWHNGG